MKKWGLIVLCAALLLGLTACGGDGAKTIASYVETEHGKLELGASFDVAAYGTPNDTQQQNSCHYDGKDTLYFYDSLTVYTYHYEGQQVVYCVELLDNTLKTPEGAVVGMTEDAVRKMYGEPTTTLAACIKYALSDTAMLSFYLQDGTVTAIEYLEE